MSFNGLATSFLPFTINGLTDATFSSSNIGNAIATTLQLTSATPLKLARFNADRELVSASVDESQVALLVGNNVFNGSQTILPGSATNINNVIKTAITAEAYNEASFTTSGITGYTAPLGTISGPTAGEYSIGQTANDRTIMKINGFTPIVKTWVYSFVIRIVDVEEGYLSVEQSGVQRSSTLRLITSELTTVSDTFTYDPTSGPIVFKIYTGSLDPWNASWSSFTLGSYTASITAPLSAPLVATAISTTTIGTEILAFPSTLSNTEAWSVYSISTMGDPSSLGGLIFQEETLGVGAYITGGVVGAKSFRFNTVSGDAGKIVVTNANQVMSTSISAGQLQYITGLTSQAANSITTGTNKITQQYNATTAAGDISTLVNRGTLDAALALVPNLLPLANTWTGSYNQFNGTVSTMGSNRFIQPYNALVTDVSTLVNRATLDASIAGLGAGILNLDNVWTGSNTFRNFVSTNGGYTTDLNGVIQTQLNSLGYNAGSFSTAGVVGSYTPPLGTITGPVSGVYTITQTAQGRSIMRIPAFGIGTVQTTYHFQFNIRCSVGTAILNVEQNNLMRSPQFYQLSTGFNIVRGSFYVDGTANSPVFKIYTGIASWTADWDSFTLSTYSANIVNAPLCASNISSITSIALRTNGGVLTMASNGTTTHSSGDNSYTKYGPSASYPGYTLAVGATPDVGSASIGQLIITDGTLFLDAANGKSIYYGSYQTDRGGTGQHQFYGNMYVFGNETIDGAYSFVKLGLYTGYRLSITGGTAANSPYIEFFAGGTRRGYLGNATNTDVFFVAENGAQLSFDVAGARRMSISTSGVITVPNDVVANGLVVNGGGTYQAGAIYSDVNWGMLFRARVVPASGGGIFGWYDSAGAERMKMNTAGDLHLPGKITCGGNPSSGILNIANPNGSYTHFGWTDNVNYIRGAGTLFDTYITLYTASGGLPRIQSSNNLRALLFDDANSNTYLQNQSGATPISFGPGTWNAGGYTIISRTTGGSSSALAFGTSPGRGVIISLTAGVVWNEMILSAGTIYTSCYGVINNYTNGGGWVYSSDKRVKKDIKDIKTARSLERIMALKPKTYKKIYHPDKSATTIPQEVIEANHVGFLAQDVMETNPHCVSEWVNENDVCDGDDGKRLGIAYGDINVHMVGAIQELKKQNDVQQKQIDQLQELVQALMARLK